METTNWEIVVYIEQIDEFKKIRLENTTIKDLREWIQKIENSINTIIIKQITNTNI